MVIPVCLSNPSSAPANSTLCYRPGLYVLRAADMKLPSPSSPSAVPREEEEEEGGEGPPNTKLHPARSPDTSRAAALTEASLPLRHEIRYTQQEGLPN